MSAQSKGSGSRTTRQSKSGTSPWIWIVIGVIILAVGGYFVWQYLNQPVFEFTKGEAELIVLLHDEEDGLYGVQYQGRQPIDLTSLTVMLEGQELYVDVKDVALVRGDQSVVLEKASKVPAGIQFTLQPGDTFDVKITFLGQTLGGNYLYGFRIGYLQGNRERTVELNAEHQYKIFVE